VWSSQEIELSEALRGFHRVIKTLDKRELVIAINKAKNAKQTYSEQFDFFLHAISLTTQQLRMRKENDLRYQKSYEVYVSVSMF